MAWADLHSQSANLASEAEAALRQGDVEKARLLYAQAAEAEARGLEQLDVSKKRTLGISAVSAASLWYKAAHYVEAQQLVYKWLSSGVLPDFAEEQLQGLLQAIWNETAMQKAGLHFAPGQVVVSVKGGDVVTGGAPLDLIVEKVQTVQSLFYRTAELLYAQPYRQHGQPSQELREMCRPWLFQAVPGSYQFAVAVQEPAQQDLFPGKRPKAVEVASHFLEILRASVEEPETLLPKIVPDPQYRGTFLKLTRNLAPTGKSFEAMEVRSADATEPITLVPSARKNIGDVIRRETPPQDPSKFTEETLTGVLRAVHLDRDWLEVTVDKDHIRVEGVGEAVDDLIGPMVNRPVTVLVVKDRQGRRLFRDIEPSE
jgi:hypothetical protein